MASRPPPVIAIDGPSASGKGTVAKLVAKRLGFHYLDSGALYRLVALAALKAGISGSDGPALGRLAQSMQVRFGADDVQLNHEVVTDEIRSEPVGILASEVAALSAVRQALITHQRAFRQAPGLVADGRDMGSVVFPDAVLKIFLTAGPTERARRRHKQLKEKGMNANIATLLQDIRQRDERDSARAIAPLQKSDDASLLDSTKLSINAVVDEVLARYVAANRVP